MIRRESEQDRMNGTVTYELSKDKWVTFDARALERYGLAAMLDAEGLAEFMPTERLPVFRNGRRIGTMAPDFEPMTAKSISPFYDVRPDDFVRSDEGWVVGRTMGASDVDCVEGFVREWAPAVME